MTRCVRGALVAGTLVMAMTAWFGAGAAAAAQPATWNFRQADVPAAQPLGGYGRGVLVAVVDTWVDPTQPEFGGRVVDEADCLPGSCKDHTYAPDSCVHGTHVAGTIASADYGVAPEADILAVQVLSGPSGSPNPSASCSGSAGTVATGIDFAVSKGARVINLSVGDEVPGLFQSSAISGAVANAASHGVVVVFAAGNQGVPLTDSYGHDALLVAATGPSGQLAGYSNFNTALTGDVNVAAPGGDSGSGTCAATTCVLSTFPDKQLGLLEGTSMAAPHVSGLAALLLAQRPGRGVSDVFSAIEKTARPLAGAGSGLIDAAKALQLEPGAHPVTAAVGSADSASQAGPASQQSATSALTAAAGAPPAATVPAAGGITPATSAPAPSTTTAVTSGRTPDALPAGGAQATATPVSRVPAPIHPAGWAGRHLAVLLPACALLAAAVLSLLRMRPRLRPPGVFSGR